MPNLAVTLKAEITRLARKEVRAETESLRQTVAGLRSELAATKRKVRDLESALKRSTIRRPKAEGSAAAEAAEGSAPKLRFSAKGLATNRQRLGLSTEDFGRLVGATGQAVSGWERGLNKPRDRYLPAIAELRTVGKRDAAKRLAELAAR
jgi:DNA-binding transcriptional regulator YiaG